jgi:hypothetical protein
MFALCVKPSPSGGPKQNTCRTTDRGESASFHEEPPPRPPKPQTEPYLAPQGPHRTIIERYPSVCLDDLGPSKNLALRRVPRALLLQRRSKEPGVAVLRSTFERACHQQLPVQRARPRCLCGRCNAPTLIAKMRHDSRADSASLPARVSRLKYFSFLAPGSTFTRRQGGQNLQVPRTPLPLLCSCISSFLAASVAIVPLPAPALWRRCVRSTLATLGMYGTLWKRLA